MSLEPIELMRRLDAKSTELAQRADELTDVQRKLEPVQAMYDEFIEAYVAGLWEQHTNGELKKWPGEDVRLALARRDMPKELLGRHSSLRASESRLDTRLGSLKKEVEAIRSLLSAAKEL